MTVLAFKPRLTEAVNALYLSVQGAYNRCGLALTEAQVPPPWVLIDTAPGVAGLEVVEVYEPAAEEDIERHARYLVRVKYDAQVAEKEACSVGASLLTQEAKFPSRSSFLLRRQHALDAELLAIQAQIICAGHLADVAVRKGLDRPQSELDYLAQKAAEKNAAADELQALIVQFEPLKEIAS